MPSEAIIKSGAGAFLCGISGSGMSALAQWLLQEGLQVAGSDRAIDHGSAPERAAALSRLGITLHRQDGRGLEPTPDVVIVSTAVEDTNPDVRAARRLNIPLLTRAEAVAALFHRYPQRVAVGGTSGKSTVTAMLGHILATLGAEPTVLGGAVPAGSADGILGSFQPGRGSLCVIEADESDGSIVQYRPSLSILTNVSIDHHPLPALEGLFSTFIRQTSGPIVYNADCGRATALVRDHEQKRAFSLRDPSAALCAESLELEQWQAGFTLRGRRARLQVPGRHNVANALAAVATADALGYSWQDALEALQSFPGLHRRLQCLGRPAGVAVIDDFAHNPDKIRASLETLRPLAQRLLILFQPHGFAPMRLMRAELEQVFRTLLTPDDLLLLPEIYYAGGTTSRDISSRDLAEALQACGCRAEFLPRREEAVARLADPARAGDAVLIMGARDPSLTSLALAVCARIAGRPAAPGPQAGDAP